MDPGLPDWRASDADRAAVTKILEHAVGQGMLTLDEYTERVDVGQWLRFGVSHPCTVFDKWRVLCELDGDGRVRELIRTFF